jgi:hypothetical protein
MKKTAFIIIFLFVVVGIFSQNIFDYLYPGLDDGIMPGINVQSENLLNNMDVEMDTAILPNLTGLKAFEYLGIFGEIGIDVMTIHTYFDFRQALFFNIADDAKANLLVGTKLIFDKEFVPLDKNVNIDFGLSGNSVAMNFVYHIGVDNYINILDGLYLYELNPYMLFKTAYNINIGVKYNLFTRSAPVGLSATGDILKWANFNVEYELNKNLFGVEIDIAPIEIAKNAITVKPYSIVKIQNMYGVVNIPISFLQDGFSIGAAIGIKYNVKRW